VWDQCEGAGGHADVPQPDEGDAPALPVQEHLQPGLRAHDGTRTGDFSTRFYLTQVFCVFNHFQLKKLQTQKQVTISNDYFSFKVPTKVP